MEYKSCSDKYIWSADDSYFYKGLSELIVDIDELIYLSLEKIRKDFVFIKRIYQARQRMAIRGKGETGRIDCGQEIRGLSELLVLQ